RSASDVASAIASLELGPVLRKRVSALSKGYSRRLLLAIGLLTPHLVLLMDEPFDGSIFARPATSSRSCARRPAWGAPSFLRFTSSRTPSGCAIASFFWPADRSGESARCASCARRQTSPGGRWRRSFLRLPKKDLSHGAPLPPLLAKELVEIVSGRALWTMLLLVCPLIGFSFVEAVSLYSEASSAALQAPAAAATLSPLDGILVPTFGSFYVAVTLLFPFVAIRVLGQEKEAGALRLLVQL